MHARHPTTLAVLCAAVLGGCGSGGSGPVVATTPQSQRTVAEGGRIVLRGDFAPGRHGPLTLDGRYTVRFTQRGAGVDFTREVPFTAHLEQPVTGRAPRTIRLFEQAARAGTTTVTARGRFLVVVDFGDSPYELVLTPAGR